MNAKPLPRNELINKVKKSHQDFCKAISLFSEKELNTTPFEGSWVAGQVTEHMIKSNTGILDQLMDGIVMPADRPSDEMVKTIQDVFRDMGSKAKSDEKILPGKPPHDLKELLKTLEQQKELLLTIVKTKNLQEFSMELEFPGVGLLSRYEWIHMMIEHDQRHKRQIENIYKALQEH